MIKKALLAVFVVGLGIGTIPTYFASANGYENNDKIRICHSTQPNPSNGQGQGPQNNPYTSNKVSVSAADGIAGNSGGQGDHYAEHDGPLFVAGANMDSWGDIIPPIYEVHDGLNWTAAGQAIWNNDCKPAPVVPEKPADKVAVKADESIDCVAKVVTILTTTTTTGTTLVDNVWVDAEPVVTTSTTTRAATEVECPTTPVTPVTPVNPVTPVVTPTDDGDVLGASTQGDGAVQELPLTSGSDTLATVLTLSPIAALIGLVSVAARSVLFRQI